MIDFRKTLVFAAVSSLAAAGSLAAASGSALDPIKALAGEWRGERTDGVSVQVSYEVFGDGSAVLERLDVGDHPTMVTVYHLDGPDLRLTHFCMAGNQPRMKARPTEPGSKELAFEFVDATNLVKDTDGHMHRLVLTFVGPDRLRHQWTWMQDGKGNDSVFDLSRVE